MCVYVLLAQVCEGEGEYILDDDESPLSILMNQPTNRGKHQFYPGSASVTIVNMSKLYSPLHEFGFLNTARL